LIPTPKDNKLHKSSRNWGRSSFQIQKQPHQGIADGMVGIGHDPRASACRLCIRPRRRWDGSGKKV